ncbi:MAG TPA: hypothetical protein VJ919_09640 [Tangfeifania sp.]|nr:hypothetical protein [Tangfeifania sp.]
MTILKVTVDNKKNARLLQRMLQSMRFVTKIESELPLVEDKSQFEQLQETLDSVKTDASFPEIKDPVKWQNNLRNEWETR